MLRPLLFITMLVATQPSSAADRETCLAYLTAKHVTEVPGPVRAELAKLMGRYVELKTAIGWGPEAYSYMPSVMEGVFDITHDRLPRVPRPQLGRSQSFFTGLYGTYRTHARRW